MDKELNFIHIDLLEGQADIILRALELYSYNLVYMIGEKDNADLLKLTLLSSTYEKINSSFNSAKNRPNEVFDVETLANTVLKEYKKEA